MQTIVNSTCRRVVLGILLSVFAGLALIARANDEASVCRAGGVATDVRQSVSLGAPSHWAMFSSIWKVPVRPVAAGITIRPIAATAASKFVRTIGVNVHMAYYWTAYNDATLVKNALAYLGVKQVRDKLTDWQNVQKNYQELAAAGVKFDLLLPAYAGHPNTTDLPEFVTMVDAFARAHPGGLTAIEGPNEVNIWPVWYHGGAALPDQAALQRELYAAVRRHKDLDGIPVYNLTLAYSDISQYAQLGNLSHAANYANSHAYLNSAQTPQHSLRSLLSYANLDAPGLPIVVTETGYETNTANAYSGVNQTVQAKLTLDELMDSFAAGVSRIYLYELLDEGGESFGLFAADGSPKLAATAIHNLTAILSDPAVDHSGSSRSLNYAVREPGGNIDRLLLGKNNGTFDVVLWAESPIWDRAAKKEIVMPAAMTGVEFGDEQKTVLVFDPLQGTTPIASYHNVQSIQLALADHPVIVEIPAAAGSRPASD